MNFIPCICWVKKGVSKAVPDKVQLTQDELKRMAAKSMEKYWSVKSENVNSPEPKSLSPAADNMETCDDLEDEYNLHSYDDDDDVAKEHDAPLFKAEDLNVAFEDPYVTMAEDEWEESEKEDFVIQGSDNLLVVGHVENESSTLEVYVYNEEAEDFYVHHDIILPAYPVAVEWLRFEHTENPQGSYIAVGDMTSVINIWDLNIVDMLEPACTLGTESKPQKASDDAHSDAVLTVGWNKQSRHLLGSGSADERVFLWDLEGQRPASVWNLQKGKVQSLQWHPQEPQYLLSGTTDGYVFFGDCRERTDCFRSFTAKGEVEKVIWNHFDPFVFLFSTDRGSVSCIDVRSSSELYTLKAHNDAVTGLSLSYECPGCLVTASTDKMVKVWDILNQPNIVTSQKLKIGSIFDAKFCPDSAFVLACGGDRSSNNIVVKNILEFENCEDIFGGRSLQKSSFV